MVKIGHFPHRPGTPPTFDLHPKKFPLDQKISNLAGAEKWPSRASRTRSHAQLAETKELEPFSCFPISAICGRRGVFWGKIPTNDVFICRWVGKADILPKLTKIRVHKGVQTTFLEIGGDVGGGDRFCADTKPKVFWRWGVTSGGAPNLEISRVKSRVWVDFWGIGARVWSAE